MGNIDISGSSIRGSQTTIETMLEIIIEITTATRGQFPTSNQGDNKWQDIVNC